MPHRAGYFVLAYHWDHHCHDLVEALKARYAALREEIAEVRPEAGALLAHVERLRGLKARLEAHHQELQRRRQVIDELGHRGYGTNRDLAGALETLGREHEEGWSLLRERFLSLAPLLPAGVRLAPTALEHLNADAVLAALLSAAAEPAAGSPRAKRRRTGSAMPAVAPEQAEPDVFERYFSVMSGTAWPVNTTLFQGLFLRMGTGSQTIMRGKVGLTSDRPPQELKALGNRNFLDMYRESFASLHLFSEVGLDLLKRIHWVLSKGLDPDAGNFRRIDFPDKNGVTTEWGNLDRELADLGKVLWETGQGFHDLPRFLWDLARSYYMFIGIHPFWDSNGRVGRTFLNHMLLKKGIPPLTFRDEEEIFALPRYGGSMEEMHAYLLRRIRRAMEAYLSERERLQRRGLLGKEVFNVTGDSGMRFRQLNDSPQKLEVCCTAYLLPDGAPLAAQLVEQCRVVLPSEELARSAELYCGLADGERGEWKRALGLQAPALVEEVEGDVPGARAFELTWLLEMDEAFLRHDWFYCSVVSPVDKRVFSNKGIYFGTRIEKRSYGGALATLAAERWAQPAFKWIGPRRMVRRAPEGEVSCYPGGVGFSLSGAPEGTALKVLLEVWRADGLCERYLVDAHAAGGWGGDWQKWETHQLPLFPWDGAHGHLTFVNFGYLVHREGRAHVSQHCYKLANFADFTNEATERDDFWDPSYKTANRYVLEQVDAEGLQAAYDALNRPQRPLPARLVFTRGNPGSPEHPVHEIHRAIDRVIERKKRDRRGRHYIHLAIFDFDHEHVVEHLLWAKQSGVEVECIADWAAVSPCSSAHGNVARLRRAGVPVLGVVRNTPGAPEEGIGSMHTKFIVFDGEVVHTSSYNLHFHLWGGNREEVLILDSPDAALQFENVFQALRGGVVQPVTVDPAARFNLYYSFGYYRTREGSLLRAQDALVSELDAARESIDVCMFDVGFLTGRSLRDGAERDVVTALVQARDRGVKVKVLLNGQIAHTGPLPEAWDKAAHRPLKPAAQRLKDAWVDTGFAYYHESVYSPIHHKFAAIDGRTCIIGSYNWYEASVVSDEVLMVVREPALAQTLRDEARRLESELRVTRE